jgi:hypothetical protein
VTAIVDLLPSAPFPLGAIKYIDIFLTTEIIRKIIFSAIGSFCGSRTTRPIETRPITTRPIKTSPTTTRPHQCQKTVRGHDVE